MNRIINNEIIKKENTFSRMFTLTDNASGSLNVIKPGGILDIFQTAAGVHADNLGVGGRYLMENGKCWVLESVSYKVLGSVLPHSDIAAETYFRNPGRLFYERDYIIYDKSGNKLIIGTSRWLVIDIKTRRPLLNAIDYGCVGRDECVMSMHEKIRYDFSQAEVSGEYKIHLTETDIVGHFNNSRYADVIFEFYPFALKNLQIDFIKECKAGENITVKSAKGDDGIYVEGSVKGERRFVAKFNY